MKILATADWHLHNFKEFSKILSVKWDKNIQRYCISEDTDSIEMNSRLFDIVNGLCDMRQYCENNNIYDVVVAGDIFHHRGTIDVTVFNAAYKVIKSFKDRGITLYLMAGNHDDVDSSLTPQTSIQSFKGLAKVIETPKKVTLRDNTTLCCVPFSKDKEYTIKSIESMLDSKNAILVAHIGMMGGKVAGNIKMTEGYTLEEIHADKWNYVILGHYHQPQYLADNTIYCGSPIQTNFGEGSISYNGFFVVDTQAKTSEFVSIVAPRFITIENLDGLNGVTKEFLNSNYIRVKAQAENLQAINDKLTEINEGEFTEVKLDLEKEYVKEHRSNISVTSSLEDVVITYAKEFWKDENTLDEITKVGLDIMTVALQGGKE